MKVEKKTMGLNAIFGVNGVGKDTIAEELRKKYPNLVVTSMSRMLMYILGITKTYDVRENVEEFQYKQLEEISQEEMIRIEQEEYKDLLEGISKTDNKVVVLCHLISALRHGNKVQYLTQRQIPGWFIDLNDNLIQLKAPAEKISERRAKDKNRTRNCDIDQIIEHQTLCDKEWERIEGAYCSIKPQMIIVDNIDLKKATEEVENVLF